MISIFYAKQLCRRKLGFRRTLDIVIGVFIGIVIIGSLFIVDLALVTIVVDLT